MKITWLWSQVYKGLEISHGQRGVLLGWTHRYWKGKGW